MLALLLVAVAVAALDELIPPGYYRYRNLRLLIQGRDHPFLGPGGEWSADHSTLVAPMDGSVRLQFRFQNAPP